MKTVFDDIYEANVWGNVESRSGDGSDMPGTARIREMLSSILADLNVRSMLDLPCGDFNWMRMVPLEGIDYTGGDIVARVVERNQETFGREGVRFRRLDARTDRLPRVDLIFCRDMLVHLSFGDVRAALRNFRASGSSYLLTTTFSARDPNRNISTGEWRPLNLRRPPFQLPRPERLLVEDCREWNGYWADKCMGLWKLPDLDTPFFEMTDEGASS